MKNVIKKTGIPLLLLLAGYLIGMVHMAYMAQEASSMFVESLIQDKISKYDGAAVDAYLEKDYLMSSLHCQSSIALFETISGSSYEEKVVWNLDYPLLASYLTKLSKDRTDPEDKKEAIMSIYNVRLARSLELLGFEANADIEYEKAKVMMVGKSKETLAEFGDQWLSQKFEE